MGRVLGMGSILLSQESIFSSLSLSRSENNPSGEKRTTTEPGERKREHTTHMHNAGRFTEGTQHTNATRSTRTRSKLTATRASMRPVICPGLPAGHSRPANDMTRMQQFITTTKGPPGGTPPSILNSKTQQQHESVPLAKSVTGNNTTPIICMHIPLE